MGQTKLPPGLQLPAERAVIPFDEQGAAAPDRAGAVAAVIDHQIDAAAFPLPLLRTLQIPASRACADLTLAEAVLVGEGPQPCRGWLLAQCPQKPAGRVLINLSMPSSIRQEPG